MLSPTHHSTSVFTSAAHNYGTPITTWAHQKVSLTSTPHAPDRTLASDYEPEQLGTTAGSVLATRSSDATPPSLRRMTWVLAASPPPTPAPWTPHCIPFHRHRAIFYYMECVDVGDVFFCADPCHFHGCDKNAVHRD